MFKSINTNNELSNFDIIKIIEDMKLSHIFGGVYSKNEIPTLERNKFYIINLQDSDAGNGSHWTVFFYHKPLKSIYYDSFGFVAPIPVQEKIKPYIYNDKEIQNYKSSACGYYCIAFIKFLHNKNDKEKSFLTFLKLFNLQTFKNDKILYDLLYS
jgi:hypothetical protein